MKAYKDGLCEQVAHILSDGVKQGEFDIPDVNATRRAVFDATVRFHHPAHAEEWNDPALPSRIDAAADTAAEGPGSAVKR